MRIDRVLTFFVLTTLILAACSPAPTPDQQIASAEQDLAKGEIRTAFIKAKTALQADPDNANGRRLLGEIHLASEDGAAAEKELRRARELGLPPVLITPPLVKALLLQGRFDEVLALLGDPAVTASTPAELEAARAHALIGLGDNVGAERAIAAALAADGQNAFALLARVQLQAQVGKAEQAIATAKELVRLHPADGPAWSALGNLLVAQKDYAAAEEAFSNAITHRERNSPDQLQRAITRIAQQKFDAAQEDIDPLLKRSPGAPLVQYAAGLLESQRGHPEKAVEFLQLSYQGAPDFPPTLLLLAANHAALGRFAEAREAAERLVSRAPALIPARILHARLLLQMGEADKAAQALQAVVVERPDLAEAKRLLAAALLAQGKAAEAEQMLAEVVAGQADSARLQLQLGLTQLAGGKTEGGLDALATAGRLAPDDAAVQSAWVAAQLRQQDMDDALVTAQRFAAEHPEQAAAHNLEGAVRLSRQEEPQAVAAFEKALAADPGNVTASRALAVIRARQGNFAEAESLLAIAAERHPEDLGVAMQRATLLEQQGDAAAAIEQLKAAVQRYADNPVPRLTLGRLLLREGRAAEAVPVLDVPVLEDLPAGRLLLAEALLRTGDNERAKGLLEDLDRANPRSVAVLTMLTAVYEAQRDWVGMGRLLEQLLPLAPADERVKLAKVRLLAVQGRLDEAQRLLSELNPDENRADELATRRLLARRSGDVPGELAAADTLFELEPSKANVVALADVHLRAGEGDKAIALLTNWVGEHPEDRAVALVLAALYVNHGRREEGVAVYRRVLDRYPEDRVALNELAWVLHKTDPREARNLAERAYALAPNAPEIADTLAMALLEEGELDRALEVSGGVIRQAPNSPLFRLHRAEILARSGDLTAASSLLDELLVTQPPPGVRAQAEELRTRLGEQ